ncbi:HpcH/HpaI aldolase family protein [Parasphingorhabdus sp.]|uniref:HpcH/HpaI aldolase family protein n=1 Tax=Parasphingorhabdus sp. TaxID=2709688 RepID=UPI003BAF2BA9
MRSIKAREILANGGTLLNGWSVFPGAMLAEAMVSLGWDCYTIDAQHGIIGSTEMVDMLRAISTTEVTPMVRIAANDSVLIGQALDAGAMGVICPLVNSADEAAAFVRACQYPPDGTRSSGPTRAIFYSGFDYGANANQQILKFAMIETKEGLENVDAIAATPDLDGLYVGPSDLSLELGGTAGYDKDEQHMIDAYKRIAAACQKQGLVAGIHSASPAFAERMAGLGFRLITLVGDLNFIMAGRASVADTRSRISATE